MKFSDRIQCKNHVSFKKIQNSAFGNNFENDKIKKKTAIIIFQWLFLDLSPKDEAMIYEGFLERSKNIRERKTPIGYVHLPPIYIRINKFITFRMFSQRHCSLRFSADGKNIKSG